MKEQIEEKNTEMGSVITRTEEFLQKNQKRIIAVIAILFAIALIIFCYFHFYKQPREKKAASAMYSAENYFISGDYQTALDGDGQTPGFLAVIDQYGSTKSGKLAKLYAGIANLRLGEYDKAIKFLKDYSGKDLYSKPIAIMGQGDAEAEKGNFQEAAKLYTKAAETNENEVTTPTALFKAGLCHFALGNNANALECYEKIKKDYPYSTEYTEVDKYIGLAEAK